MNTRSNFVKTELNKIYEILNISYEYVDLARLENGQKFVKVFEVLMDISEKSKILKDIVRNNCVFL